jgi:hypothetical protein
MHTEFWWAIILKSGHLGYLEGDGKLITEIMLGKLAVIVQK